MRTHLSTLISRLALALVVAIAGLGAGLYADSATATTRVDEIVARVVADFPGSTPTMVRRAIVARAKQRHITVQRAAEQALAAAGEAATSSPARPACSSCGSSGGSAHLPLPQPRERGDIFYTPASTYGVDHGHTGLFFSINGLHPKYTVVIEAPGAGKLSHRIFKEKVGVDHDAAEMAVNVTQARRNGAAAYARAHLLRLPYPSGTGFFSKDLHPKKVDCSQLVWIAFKLGAKVDLDSNHVWMMPGVYPADILNSNHVSVYRRIA